MILFLVLACAAYCAAASGAQKRTLAREADPIALKASSLENLVGSGAANLRMFAARGGKLKPIPFQIDHRDKNGEYIFTQSDAAKLAGRDEIAFMAVDAGDRIGKKLIPSGALKGMEIEIADPVNKQKAWVYIFSFPAGKAPELSSADYVRCVKNCAIVESNNYSVGFSKICPLVFDTLIVKKDGGGNGKDALDRLKVRFHGETKFGLKIDRTEEDFTSELTGVIDGPVRVIRRTENRMILYAKLPTPSAFSEQVFYRDSFIFPITINIPLKLELFLRNTYLSVTSESSMNWGSRFYNNNNRRGVDIDGKMSKQELDLDKGSYNWQVVAGTKPGMTGGWLNRLEFDRKKTPADVRLYYLDDVKVPGPPDEIPGQFGNLGYKIIDIEKLTGGQHKLMTYMYNVKSYKPGGEKKYLAILDKPLAVKASAMGF